MAPTLAKALEGMCIPFEWLEKDPTSRLSLHLVSP